MRENKFLIVLVIILSLALAGSISYIVAMKVNNNVAVDNNDEEYTEENINGDNDNDTSEKDNTLTNEEAIAMGDKLYNDLLTYFLENMQTTGEGYLDSSKDNSCNVGIGCLPITNWSIFTQIVSKDYQYNKNALERYGVEMINDKPYAIDGYNDYDILDFKLDVKSKTENMIEFQNNLTTSEGKEITKLVIVKEDNNWKVKDFD